MLDQDFLQYIVQAANLLSLATPQSMMTIKDVNSVHIFCSEYLANLTGLALNDLLGKKVWLSLYDNDHNIEKIILVEDKEIINSREQKIILKINRFATGIIPYLALKTPVINPTTNHVVGILFQGFEIGANLLKQMTTAFDLGKSVVNIANIPKLTNREKQVIFFFMAHLSSHEIAEILSKIENKMIRKSTIDSIFNDQLYIKFDVYSRVALYQKLQSLGYDQLIPENLLLTNSIGLNILRAY